jgi:tRNA(fMet)-specific endonuclease VapC
VRKGVPRGAKRCDSALHARYQHGQLHRKGEIARRTTGTGWTQAKRDRVHLSITEGEIRYGLAKLPKDSLRRSAVEGFLAKLQIMPWGSAEAAAYGELRAKQESSGKPLASLDMLIAAHAIAVDAILVTNDRAFRQVRELPGIVNWAADL